MESRTQGSRPRPRTDPLEAKDQGHRRKCSQKRSSKFFSRDLKKKGLEKNFLGEEGLQKLFFRRSVHEETKKKVFADFPQGFWRFPTTFQRFKNSAVLESRTGQFSRPRTSKCVLKDVLEAKDVLEDSTSAHQICVECL